MGASDLPPRALHCKDSKNCFLGELIGHTCCPPGRSAQPCFHPNLTNIRMPGVISLNGWVPGLTYPVGRIVR